MFHSVPYSGILVSKGVSKSIMEKPSILCAQVQSLLITNLASNRNPLHSSTTNPPSFRRTKIGKWIETIMLLRNIC